MLNISRITSYLIFVIYILSVINFSFFPSLTILALFLLITLELIPNTIASFIVKIPFLYIEQYDANLIKNFVEKQTFYKIAVIAAFITIFIAIIYAIFSINKRILNIVDLCDKLDYTTKFLIIFMSIFPNCFIMLIPLSMLIL